MKVSKSERDSCLLSERNLKVGARNLKECGFVVIEDAICCSWVDRARAACDRALKQCMDALTPEEQEPLQRTNVPMVPPVCSPFWDAVAIENPLAVQVSEALIGRDFFCTYYNTNTQWPQSGQQHVHRDFEHLFVGHPVPLPISQIAVNIPLIDFTIENGATEVSPGSHLIVDDSPEDSEVIDERAAQLSSVRTTVSVGSIILRDMRTWHRGMPNKSNDIRTMLAMVYSRPFLNTFINAPELIEIPRITWEQLSDRAKHIFRYNPVVDKEPPFYGKVPLY